MAAGMLCWGIENYRGRRAWEACRRELLAAGEKLDLADFVPAPVPDEQNFAMTPLLASVSAPRADAAPTNTGARGYDTNAVERVRALGRLVGTPLTKEDGREFRHILDLPRRAVAMDRRVGRTNATPPDWAAAARQILAGLAPAEAALSELRAAAPRPYARFDIRYGDGANTRLAHLSILKDIANVAQLRAVAELELGRTDDALADLAIIRRVGEALKTDPFSVAGSVRVTIVQIELQALWEGLATHRFNESQLGILQTNLADRNLLANYVFCLRAERAQCNESFSKLRRKTRSAKDFAGEDAGPEVGLMPAGWVYQNQAMINRLFQEMTAVDTVGGRLDPRRFARDSALQKQLAGFTPYEGVTRQFFRLFNNVVIKFAYGQASVDQAVIACALERHRLARGRYPANLAELAPRFLATLPTDLVNGEPLHYRLLRPDHFQLYSVGWNLLDDGGVTGETKTDEHGVRYPNLGNGDWVWDNQPVAP